MPSSTPSSGYSHGCRLEGEPLSLRQRPEDGVWPEPFVEAVTIRVANNASKQEGRLAAAQAITNLFQVCSTWRRVSQSDLLWQTLTYDIWFADALRRPTWREEYTFRQRTALNFRIGNSTHTAIAIHDSPDSNRLVCRRLALSDLHLASGYVDGSVRLFELPSSRHIATFHPDLSRDHLGLFSRSISGLFLDERHPSSSSSSSRLVFASQAGDIEVASTGEDDRSSSAAPRLARVGNSVEDGVLVDFSGHGSYWVGLFSGVPDMSFRVWEAQREGEQLVSLYVGGNLMNRNALIGWRMLTTEYPRVMGRVRVAEERREGGAAVIGCSTSTIQTVEVSSGMVLEEHYPAGNAVVGSFDACEGNVMVVEWTTGLAKVHQAGTMEELCRFSTGGGVVQGDSVAGGLNWGYVVVCRGSRIRVWDVRTGECLFTMRERVGGNLVAVSEQYAAVWAAKTGLHLWNFMN